jgi:uncharacterized protein
MELEVTANRHEVSPGGSFTMKDSCVSTSPERKLTNQSIRVQAENKMKQLMKGHDVAGHGVDHMIAVADHAVKALEHEDLPTYSKVRVELAALYHDIDDRKIFKDSKNYENARRLLGEIITPDVIDEFYKEECNSIRNHMVSKIRYCSYFIDMIIDMIDLVSCSKNGDKEPPLPHMAIPRDCDRLEAIGQIGIDRCFDFTKSKGAPFHTDSTPRAFTDEEVKRAATRERFTAYMSGSQSASMIDHYYDKLLHIGAPECLRSKNPYILKEAAERNQIMTQYVINYWIEQSKR